MKHIGICSLIIIISLLSISKASAQVIIDFNQLNASQNVRLKLFLQEEETNDPIGYASVYLTPENDSTIAYFALSDEKGEVVIKDIVPGKYEINAEMIGYMPYKVTKNLKGWEVNLGAISMKEDTEMLNAAQVSATGNAVMVKGDTLVYNASSFHVGENAMLSDLLKKMPGMKVDQNGNVTVDGEKVDRITVGGKTFFFDDPSMAVKNLPAKLVEKISVVDKDKDEASFSGVTTSKDKEKVMDVGLKEEYKKGWFGNITAKGGSNISGQDNNPLSFHPGALFNISGMVAGYNEKDQITILGNGKNVDDNSAVYFGSSNDNDDFQSKRGQSVSAQGGLNYNTDRIKDVESNISANYNFARKDAKERASRISFMPEGDDLHTNSSYDGIGDDQKVNVTVELKKKDTKKYMFNIRPNISFTQSDRNISSSSETMNESQKMNSSNTQTVSESKKISTTNYLSLGVKDLGKERRNLTLNAYILYDNSKGNSLEKLKTVYDKKTDIRNLRYDNQGASMYTGGHLSYVEPIGEKWSMQAIFRANYINKYSDRAAFDADNGSRNTYYSSLSKNHDLTFSESLIAQYKKDRTHLTFGLSLNHEQNITYSKALGTENTTGNDLWILNWSPSLDLRHSKDNMTFNLYAGGWSNAPGGQNIIPALNITNPVQISTGNTFLKPEFTNYYNGSIRYNNPKKQTFVSMYLWGNMTHKKIVYASWFDENGIRYAIPVNSPKIGSNISVGLTSSIPLDKGKNLKLSIHPSFSFNNFVSYQATGVLPGLDKDNFDYRATMEKFWGDRSGNLFYSGKSGFAASKTNNYDIGLSVDLDYTIGDFTISVNGDADNSRSRYTLDPTANMNTWDFNVGGDILWQGSKGWEIQTKCKYNFYRGYTMGYGSPEVIWDASISKTVKSFTFSISASDILNQRKMLSRSVTSGYMQDTYNNIMGRYILAGITFNFGKMNATNNRKVQNAVYQMMY